MLIYCYGHLLETNMFEYWKSLSIVVRLGDRISMK